jgi:anti-sigma regulatory factor (Ser/Thr protein kinase)
MNFTPSCGVFEYAGQFDRVARFLTGGPVDWHDTPPKTSPAGPMADAGTFRLSIETALSEIGKVMDLLEDELAVRKVPLQLVQAAQTVADELVTNVIRHGCRDDRRHTIDVTVAVGEDALTLQFSDDGIPFNPFDRPAPDLTRPISERQAGGMGIPLVRQLAAEYGYAHVDERNQVTVVLKQPAP